MKRRVLFLIETLGGGGAEKVLSTLVRHLDKERYDVTVFAIIGGGKYAREVADEVSYLSLLDDPATCRGFSRLWYALRYKLVYQWLPTWLVYRLFVPKSFDVEVAFVEGFVTKLLAASSNRRARKIAWVHVDLIQRPWPIELGIFRDLAEERAAYNLYNKVVCVSKSVERVMTESYGLRNTTTIYNPLDVELIRRLGGEAAPFEVDHDKFNLVSVGRFTRQKGYDLLLPIVARLKQTHLNVHLWLIGEGEDEPRLRRQVLELGIDAEVSFTGFLKNPYSLMSKMDLFVCSSRAEGFSLVIAESMILGVPVVSMNCSGPNELIGKNEYGVLCDTYEELETEIGKVMDGKVVPCVVPPLVDLENTLKQIELCIED